MPWRDMPLEPLRKYLYGNRKGPAGLGNWSAERLDQGRRQAYPATSTLHTARDTNRVVTVTPGFCCLNKLI